MFRRTAARALLLGNLGLALLAGPAFSAESQSLVYGATHAEAALGEALARHITIGRMRLEIDNRAAELRVPAGQTPTGAPRVENLYYNPVQARFAAELVVPGTTARLPVSGRAYGTVDVPVLSHRVSPGDTIAAGDVDWVELRADQAGTDVAATEAQLIGMTPKRGIPVNQPVRIRDLQSPRIVDKGSLVTITLETGSMSLSTQGKALQEGGKGDVIRVVNTASNRIVEAVVSGPSRVSVGRPGTAVAAK
ncbi:flagellar basal body P-ring formation chaperone FlgA [Azospirillum sp. TSO22-1]|uniref:flagellar basal body P-ring formation chaperone FlgA n=1 Tax=Azospirillum sp. TSO22-1 TaxID=716789 RepID=UPI000D613B65|nr:flagellar basal body P-ring formation chaperone FlgA [Azospirillum sp. TSO22-1]PWC40841.1 flagellin biosynthesis protein FlgA [Azospirillum sp. TSO22-1]